MWKYEEKDNKSYFYHHKNKFTEWFQIIYIYYPKLQMFRIIFAQYNPLIASYVIICFLPTLKVATFIELSN